MTVLIAIPCFNCEKQITRVLEELESILLDFPYKVIVIDNRSTDDTVHNALTAIKKYNIHADVLVNKKNIGLGGSHKVAFHYASESEQYSHIAILHGDNQARSRELKNLVEVALHSRADYILGSRFMKNSNRINYSRIRTTGNILLNFLYSVATRKPIKDLGSGLNLYKVTFLKRIDLNQCSNDLNFNMDFLLQSIKKGVVIKYTPITWREEDQVSNARILSIGIATILSLYYWLINKNLRYKTSIEYDIVP